MMIYTDTKYRPKRKPKKTAEVEKTLTPLQALHRRMQDKPINTPQTKMYRRGGTQDIPSLETRVLVCEAKDIKHYTGDKLLGIAILHKSCLQPVFSQEEAEDAAHMRR
jgi:hypothetical protein